ncbi:hypothetical protein [Tropicibacter naphthalenivorans]|uniref:Lipid A core-O-antigen ligase n=1 Tax=Tropicibacter naphthalenivorans TaxID=441103 RepID=A0A0N7M039_9RHOB|nr:hypothetical protein [Tropicibacter naphthalenivorans]CUH79393.1 Lipid A core-O-antigen ligase [Tropicibacter naphthalenivorans]SMC71879.1 hypothetical protein SAMN04488093_10378 [Tropicibacter naphthalenivorans]
MPNPIAYLALALWPLVVAVLFGRMRPDRALVYALMLGYLFLPEPPAVFDPPLMPPLNKYNMPAFAAFVISLWRFGDQGSWLPQSGVGKALLFTFVLSPVMTVLTNEEPVFFGQVGLPGLRAKDAVALVLQQFLMILPFLLARKHLATGGSLRELAKALMVGGLVYSVLMLIEIRLSPQLNLWVYGYYQHYFAQSIRFGGYRPVVFLYHGLWVAFFTMTAVVAAFGLWRSESGHDRAKLLMAALYLFVILVLAKSLGSLIFALVAVPAVVLLPLRGQLRVALVIGVLALGYPLAKGAHIVPEGYLIAQAAAIDQDRAGSIEFRFDNENTLLERAYLKPVFGWGSWGRNHILDPISGQILTVTDGRWIVTLGTYGWVGFLSEFGLLLLPLVLISREVMARKGENVSLLVGPLAILLAINVSDMIPNGTMTPITWLLVGALTGYAETLRAERLKVVQLNTGLRWRSVM